MKRKLQICPRKIKQRKKGRIKKSQSQTLQTPTNVI